MSKKNHKEMFDELMKRLSEHTRELIKEIDEDEEVQKKISSFKKDYFDMMKWAFGFDEDSVGTKKDKIIAEWAKNHAELPELFLPECLGNDSSNMLVLMQIIPYWNEYKKTRPCDCGCCS